MSQRFRRLTDLFVAGVPVELPDHTNLWVQAINAYERDECINDAQVARARLVMALRENGEERLKIEGRLVERGRDAMADDVAQAKVDAKYTDVVSGIEDDPDWVERVSIMRRSDFTQSAKPPETDERALLDTILTDWTAEIAKRLDDELAWQKQHYAGAGDDELLTDYLELWLDKRGSEIANAEYTLTEMWYAARYCEASAAPGEPLDHAVCDGHPNRVFDDKGEARSAPDQLQQLLLAAIRSLAMVARDPKGSASPTSSSDSSPTPSAPEGSTPSTSDETPSAPPGTSPLQSVTP